MPLRITIMQQMAGILAIEYTESTAIKPISKKWVYNFIKHYNNLKSKFNYKYNY